ncbi:MAG: prepilin peptidase [Candidatus Doudnabacteria bacterium]|nr:prepilin peptidase [Candidatus Doudnabacteria bacterium]
MPFLIFIFGLIVGSFLNAVIHRLHVGESILETHSRCPHCRHILRMLDLIPMVSFFLLRGRCRYCGQPISRQYPLVELATAIAFVLIYTANVIPAKAGIQFWIPGSNPRMTDYIELLFQFAFASFLIVIFVYDFKHYLILDKVVFPGAGLALIYQVHEGNWEAALLGAGALSGFFAFLYFLSKGRWIGFGDVKLGVFLGFLVPWPQTLTLFFLAYFMGAVVSLILISANKKRLTDQIPFGTFLTIAAFFAMLWGEEMVGWYFGLIGLS